MRVSPGKQEFFVSKRGEAYLIDLSDSNQIVVTWKGGRWSLPLELAPSVPGTVAPQIGTLHCGGGK